MYLHYIKSLYFLSYSISSWHDMARKTLLLDYHKYFHFYKVILSTGGSDNVRHTVFIQMTMWSKVLFNEMIATAWP